MTWKALLVSGALALSACSGETQVVAPSPTPKATAVPVAPSSMTLDVTLAFKAGQNSLGDPIENLSWSISSNAPVSFEADLTMTTTAHFQSASGKSECVQAFGSPGYNGICTIDSGKRLSSSLFWTAKAPAGRYTLTVTVLSYSVGNPLDALFSSGDYSHQSDAFTKWVGGQQGPLLRGNPFAVPDPKHPAVLNLQRIVIADHG